MNFHFNINFIFQDVGIKLLDITGDGREEVFVIHTRYNYWGDGKDYLVSIFKIK